MKPKRSGAEKFTVAFRSDLLYELTDKIASSELGRVRKGMISDAVNVAMEEFLHGQGFTKWLKQKLRD